MSKSTAVCPRCRAYTYNVFPTRESAFSLWYEAPCHCDVAPIVVEGHVDPDRVVPRWAQIAPDPLTPA